MSYNIDNNSFTKHPSLLYSFNGDGTTHFSVLVGDIIYFNNKSNMNIGTYNIHSQEFTYSMDPSVPINVHYACLVTDNRYVYVKELLSILYDITYFLSTSGGTDPTIYCSPPSILLRIRICTTIMRYKWMKCF